MVQLGCTLAKKEKSAMKKYVECLRISWQIIKISLEGAVGAHYVREQNKILFQQRDLNVRKIASKN